MNELTGSKGSLITDTQSLREIAPLLENYFGITLGYFTNEIELSTGKHAAKAIREDHEIRLPANNFDYDAYMEWFGQTPLLTNRLREALLFVAYIMTDRKFSEEDISELGYWEDWNTYKGEWAKLVLFMEETEQRHRNLYERVGEQEMPVTLRTNSRKQEPLTLPNTNNWLFRLIRKELADYFPDIQNAEDAQRELAERKPSAGAKPMNTFYPIVAYGIYRMLHEENAIPENPDTPNELCKLIYDYTRFVGCYPSYKGYDGSFNPKNIRADISYIKKNVQKYGEEKIPKFPSVKFGNVHMVTENIIHKDLF